MKTVFIILIIGVGFSVGIYFSERLKHRCRFLKSLMYMLEELRLLIEYEAAEVGTIVKKLLKNKHLSELDFLEEIHSESNIGADFGVLWENAIEEKKYGFLNSEEREFIKEIGRKLGKSDTNGQLTAISFEKKELEILIKNAEDEYSRKGKLYRSLGVLGGAFIAVFLY